jgi:hypothetical protein
MGTVPQDVQMGIVEPSLRFIKDSWKKEAML